MKKLANALNAFWEREGRDAYSLSPLCIYYIPLFFFCHEGTPRTGRRRGQARTSKARRV